MSDGLIPAVGQSYGGGLILPKTIFSNQQTHTYTHMETRTIGIFSVEPTSILSMEELEYRKQLKQDVFNAVTYDLEASNVTDKATQNCTVYMWATIPTISQPLTALEIESPTRYMGGFVTESRFDNAHCASATVDLLAYLKSKCRDNSSFRVVDLAWNNYWNLSSLGTLQGDAHMLIDLYNQHQVESYEG